MSEVRADSYSPRPQVRGPYGTFRHNDGIRSFLVILLMAKAMLTLFHLVVSKFNLAAHLSAKSTKALYGSELAGSVILFLFVFFFMIWINRVCKNGWLLDAPKMKTTPGWAVGYYFIPVISLWKPFATMLEIRDASYGRRDQLTTVLPLWWLLWLTALGMFSLSYMMNLGASSKDGLAAAQKLGSVASLVSIILDYVTIALVVGITKAQKDRVTQWRP